MESSESDDEEEDEEEDLLGNILVDFLGGFVFSMKEAFFGLLSSSLELELELELELSGSSSPPLPFVRATLSCYCAPMLLQPSLGFIQAVKNCHQIPTMSAETMTETATLQALSSRS
jgi:hypothetical protein